MVDLGIQLANAIPKCDEHGFLFWHLFFETRCQAPERMVCMPTFMSAPS